MQLKLFSMMLAAAAATFFAGCGDAKKIIPGERMAIYSGLPPVAHLAAIVGGDRVDSKTVLPPGRSPHDYSPGPGEIRGVTSAKLFFTTGMNFETIVSRPIDPKHTRIVDVGEGVKRMPFDDAHHDHEHDKDHKHGADAEHKHDHGHDSCTEGHAHGALDPHIWLSTHNAAVMAENIAKALTAADPDGAAIYAANLQTVKKQLAECQAYAERELAPYAGREFYVYHPAFGYFANSVGLKQVGIELGGREATPAHLAAVIKQAKEQKIKVVFVQPQFNPASARALGNAIGGKVAGLDSLAADIPANIRIMTDALKEGFSAGEAK